jgi:hypothetical protein
VEEPMVEIDMKDPEDDEKLKEEVKEEVTATTSTEIKEPEPEEQEEEINTAGKYMLLDRLIRFIRQKEKPLNAVLSGYFAKLLTLLINRK